MDIILSAFFYMFVFPNLLFSYPASGHSSGEPGVDDIYDNYYDETIPSCSSEILVASPWVRFLSPELDVTMNVPGHQSQWTVVPSYPGGVVAVSIVEYTIGVNVFAQGCSDIEVYQSRRNNTYSREESHTWCREKRLLPCVMTMQMAFYLGWVINSSSGTGLQIVHTVSDSMYEYEQPEKLFTMYYYECGGRRMGGEIRSPIFPLKRGPHTEKVSCKWDLDVGSTVDYGILRFTRFYLPNCSDHYLVVEEDTIIPEDDVTDDLLERLNMSEESNMDSFADDNITGTDYGLSDLEYDPPTEGNISTSVNVVPSEDKNKITYFYRDPSDGGARTPKSGVHAIVITTYCGDYAPPHTMYWRRGSKNVSLTFVSQNLTSRSQGFEATYSVFSWEDTMKEHRGRGLRRRPTKTRSSAVDILFNYIVVIVFVPIGAVIGIGIIIYHIKRRGPTLQDFYKKERAEMQRLRRSRTERIKSYSPPVVHQKTRRSRSLDLQRKTPQLAGSSVLERPVSKYTKGIVGTKSRAHFAPVRVQKKSRCHLAQIDEYDKDRAREKSRKCVVL